VIALLFTFFMAGNYNLSVSWDAKPLSTLQAPSGNQSVFKYSITCRFSLSLNLNPNGWP
jgi:hypothetical protein